MSVCVCVCCSLVNQATLNSLTGWTIKTFRGTFIRTNDQIRTNFPASSGSGPLFAAVFLLLSPLELYYSYFFTSSPDVLVFNEGLWPMLPLFWAPHCYCVGLDTAEASGLFMWKALLFFRGARVVVTTRHRWIEGTIIWGRLRLEKRWSVRHWLLIYRWRESWSRKATWSGLLWPIGVVATCVPVRGGIRGWVSIRPWRCGYGIRSRSKGRWREVTVTGSPTCSSRVGTSLTKVMARQSGCNDHW